MHLILIRHGCPVIDPAVAPQEWRLSDEGRRRCTDIATRLARYDPAFITSSVERKATETARLIGLELGVPVEPWEGLHEHDRSGCGWLEEDHFRDAMDALFEHPDRAVFGQESANSAHRRFSTAIEHLERRHLTGTIAVVTHGTAMSLFATGGGAQQARSLWRRLAMPSAVVLNRPSHEMVHTIDLL